MLVQIPRADFVRIWDGLRSARGPVGGPSNATPLRVAFAEMPAVAVHHSLERFHNAGLAGIECLIRIQPLDDFHDGGKGHAAAAGSFIAPNKPIGPNAPCDLRLYGSSFV